MNAPCKDCTQRHVGCHVDCPLYLAEKARRDDIKAARDRDSKTMADLIGYASAKKARLQALDRRLKAAHRR